MADGKTLASLALHRFGLGPRKGSIASIASDPRGALIAELDRAGAGQIANGALLASAPALRAVADFNAERRAKQILIARAQKDAERSRTEAGEADAAPAMPGMADPAPNVGQQIYLSEVRARLDAALDAELGFVERLVWFWSNHFCISANKIQSMAGAYEREAIRPHALGRFVDLLLAAEGHPAMLFYLDNAASIGPNSIAGINRSRGLNENLAREILELHTLGVGGGYTQDDVVAFAKVLTGWTFLSTVDNPDHGGEFVFNRRLHEPGTQKVVGKEYKDDGVEQGRAVLRDLARHPATAHHVAVKLARAFVADQPPPTLIAALESAFRDSEGDIKHVAKAMINAPESWNEPRTKLKVPSEWAVGMARAAGTRGDVERFSRGQTAMGEGVWRPPSPKGFSELASNWIDGIGARLQIANNYAQRVGDRLDPAALLETALGPLATRETRDGVARAETRTQALVLLFMSPEFLRR